MNQIPTYSEEALEENSKYLLLVEKEKGTTTIKLDSILGSKLDFVDMKYMEIPYTTIPPIIQVWKNLKNNGIIKANLVELLTSLREDGANKYVMLESSSPITGFIVIK